MTDQPPALDAERSSPKPTLDLPGPTDDARLVKEASRRPAGPPSPRLVVERVARRLDEVDDLPDVIADVGGADQEQPEAIPDRVAAIRDRGHQPRLALRAERPN